MEFRLMPIIVFVVDVGDAHGGDGTDLIFPIIPLLLRSHPATYADIRK